MLGRWIFACLLLVASSGAIQRPDVKATLRGLTRMPRVEFRFSLDFDAGQGFAVLNTEKDPGLALVELREQFTGGPADAKLLLQSARLRVDAGDASARRDFQRAVDALKQRLDAEPGSARLRLDLGSALHGAGRPAEAESVFREAVKSAPNSITNWIALSAFLEARAWELAADAPNWNGRRTYGELSRRVARRQPATEVLDRAAKLLDEGVSAAREAIRLDEDSENAHWKLGVSLASRNCFELVRARIARGSANGEPIEMLIFSRDAIPSFEKAVQLDREDPTRLATLILWRAFCEAAEKKIPTSQRLWESLSEDVRARVDAEMQRLGGFDTTSDAGGAAQAMGTLRFVLQHDYRAAADDLRNAIGLNPESEQLWETLGLVLARSENFYELATINQARVLVRPSVRNRVLLADAYERLGMRNRAIEEAGGALALNNNDFAANLALANLLMRDAEEGAPARVRQALVNAERAIRGAGTGAQLVELALAQSIYHGLVDETERAREILKAALAVAKDDPDVQAALNAIGY